MRFLNQRKRKKLAVEKSSRKKVLDVCVCVGGGGGGLSQVRLQQVIADGLPLLDVGGPSQVRLQQIIVDGLPTDQAITSIFFWLAAKAASQY